MRTGALRTTMGQHCMTARTTRTRRTEGLALQWQVWVTETTTSLNETIGNGGATGKHTDYDGANGDNEGTGGNGMGIADGAW